VKTLLFLKDISLATLIRRLTDPPESLSEPMRRRARLLAWLHRVLVLLVSLALALTFLANHPGTPRRLEYAILIPGLLIVLGAAYFLNRHGHYQASAWLTVLISFIGPWSSILLDPQILDGDFIPLVYVSLSVLLCSLLLPAGVTALLAAIQLIMLWLLSLFIPTLAAYNWPSLLTYVFFLSILSILVSIINQHDMHLIDQQTEQLSESADQLQAILDNSTALIYLKDTQGRYILVNRLYEKLFHVSRAEVIGKTSYDVYPIEIAENFCESDQKVLRTSIPLEIEETIQHSDGLHSYISVKFPLRNAAGEISAMCSFSSDITPLKRVEEALREQSVRDPLTNLFNRRYMEEALGREIRRSIRSPHSIGIIMVDIDSFKGFNDTYGHAAGDAVLRALADFFNEHIRGGDVTCRYGGEEFVLILPDVSLTETLGRAEQLCRDVRQIQVQYQGANLEAITLSLGVAIFPEHGDTSETLLKAADKALYQAKAAGRDRVVVAESA
jgi:diguanylate cyclase (GGDEF)-like protein/PAS domain S-box-containing protein